MYEGADGAGLLKSEIRDQRDRRHGVCCRECLGERIGRTL